MHEFSARLRCGRLRHVVKENGQAAFEFMLVLPIFVLFLLLVVDFGMLMYEYVSVNNAAREAARLGAVNCGTGTCSVTAIKTRAEQRSGGILSDSDTYNIGWMDNGTAVDGSTGRGDSVVVHIKHEYTFLFFPYTMDVVSCSDYRLEQQDKGVNLPAGSRCQ